MLKAFREIYYLLAVLPAVLYLGALVFVRQQPEIAAAYGGMALIAPIYGSVVVGGLGVILIIVSRDRGAPTLGLVIATLVAGGISLWYVGKVVLVLVARPLLIGLGVY